MEGGETSAVLEHLSSLTEYQLAVFAVYANDASEALRGAETTRELIPAHKHTHAEIYLQNLTPALQSTSEITS